MRTLYLDCGMGAAGDMLAAALLELLPQPDAFVQKLNEIGIPGVEFVAESAEKCGIRGTHLRVLVHGEEEAAHDHAVGDDIPDEGGSRPEMRADSASQYIGPYEVRVNDLPYTSKSIFQFVN